jgi:sialidase-1
MGNRLQSAGAVNDGQWHQAVAVSDGARMQLYLDGASQGSADLAGNISYVNHSDFRVGHTENGDGVNGADSLYYFKGQIDDVRVYAQALSAIEVTDLYRSLSDKSDS